MADGDYHNQLLDVARPSYQSFAKRHGYDYVEGDAAAVSSGRPPSWNKVPLLLGMLEWYAEVLWMDCDEVIVDGCYDAAQDVPDFAWQGMSIIYEDRGAKLGEIPSCGTWLVRRPMVPYLQKMWGMTQYVDHPWWEQAAMHELLGFAPSGKDILPVQRGPTNELREHTWFMGDQWQSIAFWDFRGTPRIIHVPGVVSPDQRLLTMQSWAQMAEYNERRYS